MPTPRPDHPARLRGAAVGALTAALSVAGHGVAGGGYPDSSTLTLLVLCCAAVGALTGSLRGGRVALLGALSAGQLVGHLALSTALTAHQFHGPELSPRGLTMLAAHTVATALCAALILAAEAVYGPITRVLRSVLRRWNPLPRTNFSLRTAPTNPIATVTLLHFCISRRGPPAAVPA
ncbi:hypothetical protein [Rhodococcus sp. UNC363MFTsu5.1]|uniref:hypothetical protein n=1 Tax=Rhodococcus sp. UNC363MFTsu5.1 TaxID=1449069 RepID=UPI000489EB12|nr:hypothetical protein [Rhodococcus sp. UNC363MFTsu5.1]